MEYIRERYINDPNFTLLHIKGFHAADSVASYLHYSRRYQLIYFKRGNPLFYIKRKKFAQIL